jgi:hypothetical protein
MLLSLLHKPLMAKRQKGDRNIAIALLPSFRETIYGLLGLTLNIPD